MKLYDDRFGYLGQFSLMQCKQCSHAFLVCDLSSIQLIDLYTNYYPRKSFDIENYAAYRESLRFFTWFNGYDSSAFRWVPKNVRILDVGCGFGESLGYHSSRGCDVYGVEADENIRRVIEKFGYKVHVGLFDDKLYEENFFDYVTMDQVIEHVTDPIAVMQGISRILKPGGTAIFSTPNANGWGRRLFGARWINWHVPYHLQFFTQQSIELAAEKTGLTLSEVTTRTNSEWLHYQWMHLVFYPRKGKSSRFWSSNKSGERLYQKVMVGFLVILHKTKINHFLTRLFDAMTIGDNYIFVLKKPE